MNDKQGKPIPPRLVAVFKRPGLLMMMEKYQSLYSSVIAKMDAGDELFRDIHRATFDAIHSDIISQFKAQQPYAVCDWCEGEGCEKCKGKGWLGIFAWKLTPRKE